MKQISFSILISILVISMSTLNAQQGEEIPLPQPQRTGGMPLFEALDKRQSLRSYSPGGLSSQDLSNLLWAAFGINREDGRRTAPSARNWQQFDIYLIMADGWYMYDANNHSIIKKGNEDLSEYAGTQDFTATAPLNIIFVSDHSRITGNVSREKKDFNSATDAGFISQNVYLFCASEGLATVVRGLVDRDKLHEVLRLRPEQHVILGQSVGYPGD